MWQSEFWASGSCFERTGASADLPPDNVFDAATIFARHQMLVLNAVRCRVADRSGHNPPMQWTEPAGKLVVFLSRRGAGSATDRPSVMPHSKTAPWKVALAALFCAVGLAAVGGHYWVSYRVDQDVSRLRVIVSSLAATDSAYADLKVFRSTHPKAWIFGTVNDPQRKEVVRAKVAEAFGAEEARRIVSQIRLPLPATRASGA